MTVYIVERRLKNRPGFTWGPLCGLGTTSRSDVEAQLRADQLRHVYPGHDLRVAEYRRVEHAKKRAAKGGPK